MVLVEVQVSLCVACRAWVPLYISGTESCFLAGQTHTWLVQVGGIVQDVAVEVRTWLAASACLAPQNFILSPALDARGRTFVEGVRGLCTLAGHTGVTRLAPHMCVPVFGVVKL